MKERSILMNSESVRAILAGQKTQTRRVMRPQPRWKKLTKRWLWWLNKGALLSWQDNVIHPEILAGSPYQVGMNLWVRETWDLVKEQGYHSPDIWLERRAGRWTGAIPKTPPSDSSWGVIYRADEIELGPWHPSIHMPRWASRITLRVTDVRIEHIQDISTKDARAEGTSRMSNPTREYPRGTTTHRSSLRRIFSESWDSINAKRGFGWDVNPWVWVISFERLDENR